MTAPIIPRCPWCGYACDCKQFPWLEDGKLPVPCDALIRSQCPATGQYRPMRGEKK